MRFGIEVTSDGERVAKAFGKKLNLGRPATPQEIAGDLGRYVEQTTTQQEQQEIYNAANAAAQQIPPVTVGAEVETKPGAE